MSVSHDGEKNQKLVRMKELIRTLNEAEIGRAHV